MSATTATARAARPLTEPTTRRLRPVPAAVLTPSRGAFAILVGALLTVGLLGLLALNTALAQRSFAAHDLSQRINALTDQEQALQQQVAVLESPQSLAAKAAVLGMVPSGNPAFLDLRTGKVLGTPAPGR